MMLDSPTVEITKKLDKQKLFVPKFHRQPLSTVND